MGETVENFTVVMNDMISPFCTQTFKNIAVIARMAQGKLIHLLINPGSQTSVKLFIINTNTNSVSSTEIKVSLTGSDLQMPKKLINL